MSYILSKLLVPMSVEALVVSQNRTDCVDLGPQWNKYEQSFLGDVLQPNINKPKTLKKGVHLHWTLPKALKHTFLDGEGEMEFPYAPNRWMITRLQTDKGITKIPSCIWIVESDANNPIDDGSHSPNWILVNNNQLDFRNIGKTTEWSTEYKEDRSEAVLKTVGAVNPLFASFYPSCSNVFGFHDTMEDVTETKGTFTYLVTGWYSDTKLDPISDVMNDLVTETYQQQTLNWLQEQWKYEGVNYPTSSLFHSTVHGLVWSVNQASGVPDGDVQLFAGNTAVESLSAQIIKSNAIEKPEVEELLNALQYQLLNDNEHPPSLLKIKKEVHKRGFSPKNRNSIWEVSRKETDNTKSEKNKEDTIHFPDDNNFLQKLKSLNTLQIQLNVLYEELGSVQQEYYFLWFKQARKTINNFTIPNFDYVSLRQELVTKIASMKVDATMLKTEIKQAIEVLNQSIYLSGSISEFELKEKLEDRFWEPNDPVLLLIGDGIGKTDTPTFNSSGQTIKCRTSDQLIEELVLNVPYLVDNETKYITVTIPANAFSVPEIGIVTTSTIPIEFIKYLLAESLLLDQSLALDIALLAFKEAQLGEGKTKESVEVIKFANNTVIAEQLQPTSTDKNKVAPASFSIRKWQQAWTPLFMTWEVEYTPSNLEIQNLDVLKDEKWLLEKDHLFFKNQQIESKNYGISFQGISPFSSAVYANLKRTVPSEVVDKYRDLNLIAQALSGLNKHLVMQKPEIQLPPFEYTADPIYNFDTEYIIDTKELDITGDSAYTLGCDPGRIDGSEPNIFFPFRSGFLTIKKLSIVDAFGQVKKVITEESIKEIGVASSIANKGKAIQKSNNIPLPPRILQPSRLQFHWLNSKDETIYQDTGKLDPPVFGWLVPNYFDKNIMVYDADGSEILILQIISDLSKENGFLLSIIPFPGTTEIPNISNNVQLTALLKAINSGSIAMGIIDLASKINESLTLAKGGENNTIRMIFGQPIALARCEVSLEVLGNLACNQRWDQTGKENMGEINTVKFPLFIGDFLLENDGLLGYFPSEDYTHLYTTVNAPKFKFSESIPFFKANTPLSISLKDTSKKVTLLIDASAGVHLSTAILPTKFVELFPFSNNELIGALNASFMVAPFIAERVDPGIPIPTSINANWKWVHKSKVDTWQTNQEISEGKNKQQSSFQKQQLYEGWLKLDHLKNTTN